MLKKGNDCIQLLCLYLFESTNFPIRHEGEFHLEFFGSGVVVLFLMHLQFFFTTITPQQQSRELDGLKINISSCRGVFSISEAAILLILYYEFNGIFNFLWGGVLYDNSLMNF